MTESELNSALKDVLTASGRRKIAKLVAVGSAGGKYRQFVYTVSGGDFGFVKLTSGEPVMALLALE